MKNKNGFTLIELLAVIVVLAVVALITVPVILNVIERVRKESYRDSVYGIMESGRLFLTTNMGSINENEEIIFTCDGSKCSGNKGELSFKGIVPESGNIYISGNGLIEIESLYNGKYYANGTNEEGIEITNDSPMTRGQLEEAILAMQAKYDEEINELKVQNSSQTAEINSLKAENNTIKEFATSIDEVYPVGSIYITLSNVNPSTIFPGTTWERYSEGKTLVGDDGTNYITGNATKGSGGSSTVTLTTSNIPTLSVTGSTTKNDNIYSEYTGGGYTINRQNADVTGWSGSHSHEFSLPSGNQNYAYGNEPNAFGWIMNGSYSYPPTTNTSITVSGQVATNGYVSSISGVESHRHQVKIPSLTVNASYTNNNQTSISVQNPYTVVYMWKRIS